jgi:hypothetical protein
MLVPEVRLALGRVYPTSRRGGSVEQPFESYLVEVAAHGDRSRIGDIDAQLDGHLIRFKDSAYGVSKELIRLKREFAVKAPDTELANEILAKLAKLQSR